MTFALAVPSAGWLPERATMLDGLRSRVASGADRYQEFIDREHWTEWFPRMLRWAVGTGAQTFLTLQDDVETAPNFWPAMHAMRNAWPGDVIGVAATHSLAREVARQGRRSYRTARMVGWGWAMPMPLVVELLAWIDAGHLTTFHRDMPTDGEDTFTMTYLASKGILPRCPVPTVIDHLHVASTNKGFDEHTHRRTVVTWRGYEPADMEEPSWWCTTCATLPDDDWRRCWWCGERPEMIRSAATDAVICRQCIGLLALGAMGLRAEAR